MDWVEAYDEQGQLYYYNNTTGEQSWEPPSDWAQSGAYSEAPAVKKVQRLRGGRTASTKSKNPVSRKSTTKETYTRKEYQKEQRRLEGKAQDAQKKQMEAIKGRDACRLALDNMMLDNTRRITGMEEKYELLNMFLEETVQFKDHHYRNCHKQYTQKETEILNMQKKIDDFKAMHTEKIASLQAEMQEMRNTYAKSHQVIRDLTKERNDALEKVAQAGKNMAVAVNAKDMEVLRCKSEVRRIRREQQLSLSRYTRSNHVLVALFLAEFGPEAVNKLPPYLVRFAPRGKGRSIRENSAAQIIQRMARGWLGIKKLIKFKQAIRMAQRREREHEQYLISEEPMKLGQAVDANYGGEGEFYPATITAVFSETNTYNIEYNDGDSEMGVLRNMLKPMKQLKNGQRIEALYGGEGDEWYPGVVKNYYPEDYKVDVEYDDGETENAMRASCVRLIKKDDAKIDENESGTSEEENLSEAEAGILIDIDVDEYDSSEEEANDEPIIIRQGPRQLTAEELGFTHSVPDNSFASQLVKANLEKKTQIAQYMQEAKNLLEASRKIIKRKAVSTKPISVLEMELGILERDLRIAMKPPPNQSNSDSDSEEENEVSEDITDKTGDDKPTNVENIENQSLVVIEEEGVNSKNTENDINSSISNDSTTGINMNKQNESRFENNQIENNDKTNDSEKEKNIENSIDEIDDIRLENKEIENSIPKFGNTDILEENFSQPEVHIKSEGVQNVVLHSIDHKLVDKLRNEISMKEKEIKDKRAGQGDIIAPDDVEWSTFVNKTLDIFNVLEKNISTERVQYLQEINAWSIELNAKTHQLVETSIEESGLFEYDVGSGGEEEEEEDLGPEIFPEKEALDAIKKKMAITAPQLDQECLVNREKQVENPEYTPDEMLDPEDDPNDPDRPPQYVPANTLKTYTTFFDILDKKIKYFEKKKAKREEALRIRATMEERRRIEAEIRAEREAAEKIYQNQRINLTKQMSEACKRAIRAEGRQWSVSAQQSAAVQLQVKQLDDAWGVVASMREKLEREAMSLEEEYSKAFSKLDTNDNALHFMSIQQEVGSLLIEIQVFMTENYVNQSLVNTRRRKLALHLETLQIGEQLRQESQVKEYVALTSALQISISQFNKTDELWENAEQCNKPYHVHRLHEIKGRISLLQHMKIKAGESISQETESVKNEQSSKDTPIPPTGCDKVEKINNYERGIAAAELGIAHLKLQERNMEIFVKTMATKSEMLVRRKLAEKEAEYTIHILLLCHSMGTASDARGLSLQTFGAMSSESMFLFLRRSEYQDNQLKTKAIVKSYKNVIDKLQRKLDNIEYEMTLQQEISAGKRKLLNAEVRAIRHAKADALGFMRSYFVQKQEEMEEERRKMASTIKKMAMDFSEKEKGLENRILGLQELAAQRKTWVYAMKEDMRQLRNTYTELSNNTMEKNKKQAQSYIETRQRLNAKSNESQNRRMWITALENKISVLEARVSDMEERAKQSAQEWAGKRDALLRESWRRDETARTIITDVDELFRFFCEAIDRMSGRSPLLNDKLRHNCAIEILLALSKSPRIEIMRMAVRSIGRMMWNGTCDTRVVNHIGREMWISWTNRIANKVEDDLRKDAMEWQDRLADVKEERGLWAAAAQAGRAIGRKTIMARLLSIGNTPEKIEGTDIVNDSNFSNQEHIGSTSGSLQILVDLSKSTDKETQKFACEILAIVSLQAANRHRLLKLDDFLQHMTHLLDIESQEEVQSSVAATLANMAYNNPTNIKKMGKCGAVANLTKILVHSKEIDVLATVTAALVNMLLNNDNNRAIFHEHGGIQTALSLCHGELAISSIEVQSNTAELLANATCLRSQELSKCIHDIGVESLVLLCASQYPSVQLQVGLIMGNLALLDEHRKNLIKAGGVHALLLLVDCHEEHPDVAANALWALSNLAWSADAQDEIGKFTGKIIEVCQCINQSVQENALMLLANIMYYHEGNRRRMLIAGNSEGGGLRILMKLCSSDNPMVLANICRALGTAAHNDANAIFIAKHDGCEMLTALCRHTDSRVQQYAVWAIGNMAVHDGLKKEMIDAGAIEAVVKLNGSNNLEVRKVVSNTLNILADLVQAKELGHAKSQFGTVPGLVDMLRGDDHSMQSFAAEELAKESWAVGRKIQDEVMEFEGINSLIEMLDDYDHQDVILRALWALRNITYDNKGNQDRVGNGGATKKMLVLLRHENNDISEAAIMGLIGMCSNNSDNCRRLLSQGLHELLEMADGGSNNAGLALDLLKMVGPYKYILCTSCGFRNPGGFTCRKCGSKIKYFVLSEKRNNKYLSQSSIGTTGNGRKLVPTTSNVHPEMILPSIDHSKKNSRGSDSQTGDQAFKSRHQNSSRKSLTLPSSKNIQRKMHRRKK